MFIPFPWGFTMQGYTFSRDIFADLDIVSREFSEKITLFKGNFGCYWHLAISDD